MADRCCTKCRAIHGDFIAYNEDGWYMRWDGGDVFDADGNEHGAARGSEWDAISDVIVHVRRDGLCSACHAKANPRRRRKSSPKEQKGLFDAAK